MARLVERDFQIIDFLKESGWALSSQVSQRFFEGSRHACANRMRVLTQEGIIETLSLSAFKNKYWHERALLNLFCNLNGRTRVHRLSENLRRALGKRHQRAASDFMLAHQVLLNSVRERLEGVFPEAHVTGEATESVRVQQLGGIAQDTPDLVLTFNGITLCLELERKARRGLGAFNFAYEDRFENLVVCYDLVLYVVQEEDHLSPLMKKAIGLSRVGFCSIMNLDEIFSSGRPLQSMTQFVGGAILRKCSG